MCRKNTCPFFGEQSVCFSEAESNLLFCHFDRSAAQWRNLATGLTFPFETRFLHYVMLRLTSVEMTKCTFAFSGE
jgi:hypothetical protein